METSDTPSPVPASRSDQTRIGDRVSGDGASPCPYVAVPHAVASSRGPSLSPAEMYAYGRQLPDAREPRSEHARYLKMLRPFPIRRLSDTLFQLQSESAALDKIVVNLMLDPPDSAAPWVEALEYIVNSLHTIAACADEVRPVIESMIDTADTDAERAAVAARALSSMFVSDAPEPEQTVGHQPFPCPWCDGHGGSPDEGQCSYCQGTGIDPDDPASPL
jgi:hypothetical protein